MCYSSVISHDFSHILQFYFDIIMVYLATPGSRYPRYISSEGKIKIFAGKKTCIFLEPRACDPNQRKPAVACFQVRPHYYFVLPAIIYSFTA